MGLSVYGFFIPHQISVREIDEVLVVDIVKMSTLHTHFPQQRNSTLSNGVSAFELDLLMRRISSSDRHLNSTIFQLHIEQQQPFERDVFSSLILVYSTSRYLSMSYHKVYKKFIISSANLMFPFMRQARRGRPRGRSQGLVPAQPTQAKSFVVEKSCHPAAFSRQRRKNQPRRNERIYRRCEKRFLSAINRQDTNLPFPHQPALIPGGLILKPARTGRRAARELTLRAGTTISHKRKTIYGAVRIVS